MSMEENKFKWSAPHVITKLVCSRELFFAVFTGTKELMPGKPNNSGREKPESNEE
jgi:hypothetical protein